MSFWGPISTFGVLISTSGGHSGGLGVQMSSKWSEGHQNVGSGQRSRGQISLSEVRSQLLEVILSDWGSDSQNDAGVYAMWWANPNSDPEHLLLNVGAVYTYAGAVLVIRDRF